MYYGVKIYRKKEGYEVAIFKNRKDAERYKYLLTICADCEIEKLQKKKLATIKDSQVNRFTIKIFDFLLPGDKSNKLIPEAIIIDDGNPVFK